MMVVVVVVMNLIHACKRAFGVFFITCKKKGSAFPSCIPLTSSSLSYITPLVVVAAQAMKREILKNGES